MKSKSFEGMVCSIAGVLEAVGDRWAVLILRDLSLGLSRYEDLRRSTDVTNATLCTAIPSPAFVAIEIADIRFS